MCAFAAVAPIVRFNDLEILATPTFFFASDFRSRTSDEVHARLTTFFVLAKSRFLFWNRASRHPAMLRRSSVTLFWFEWSQHFHRSGHSWLVDFLQESWPMIKPVLFAALVCVCADPVGSSAQEAKITIDMMGIGDMSAHWQSTQAAV